MEQAAEIKTELQRWIKTYRIRQQRDGAAPGKLAASFNRPDMKKDCTDHPAKLAVGGRTVHPRCPGCQSRPALRLEQRTGLKNIAGHYDFPPALAPHDIENYAMIVKRLIGGGHLAPAQGARKLHKLWTLLAERNPELGRIKPAAHDAGQLFDAVMGVASGYNPDDIFEFIHVGHGKTRRSKQGYQQQIKKIERFIGHRLAWIPGDKTMDEIERQLTARNQHRPGAKPPDYGP